MSTATEKEFALEDLLINRFNAWRTTFGLAEAPTSPTDTPLRLGRNLEDTMAAQLAWLTGWRIERFARGSYVNQPFFGQAVQTNATLQAEQKAQRQVEIDKATKDRAGVRGQPVETQKLTTLAGPPPYEPVIDQQQIREAAVEFEHDYQGRRRDQTGFGGLIFDGVLKETVYLLNDDDEQQEYTKLKADGELRANALFTQRWTNQFEVSQAPEMAALVAMFDDQVHDSRAWFLHDFMSSREMWGDYFRYRMVYFGDESNKRLTPAVVAGRVVGIALVLGGTYSLRRYESKAFAGTLVAAAVGYQVINAATGEVEPFLPGAEQILQSGLAIGQVVAQQKQAIVKAEDALRMENMLDYLRRSGGLIEPAKNVG